MYVFVVTYTEVTEIGLVSHPLNVFTHLKDAQAKVESLIEEYENSHKKEIVSFTKSEEVYYYEATCSNGNMVNIRINTTQLL